MKHSVYILPFGATRNNEGLIIHLPCMHTQVLIRLNRLSSNLKCTLVVVKMHTCYFYPKFLFSFLSQFPLLSYV